MSIFPQRENMDDSQTVGRFHLWISYPWINKEERDFGYLVALLNGVNIDAIYDSFQLLPDVHLSERTIQRLLSIGFDGWLYILTHQCFTRKACTDELTTAIDQAILRIGPDFPMVGLLHGISIQNVPPTLRVRPCISLGDPDWKQQLCEALRKRLARAGNEARQNETRFVWEVHSCYCSNPSMTAVEVRSKEESVQYWRFAIPKTVRPVKWGQGPSGGREISRIRFAEATGSGRYGNIDVTWFGAANIISNTESAYAVFSGPLPEFICFGPAQSPFGPPKDMEIYWTAFSGKAVPAGDSGSAGL
jgi:hypothetical protein